MNMMNILVIGNGFDLAHNLPTRYNDFLSFIEKFEMYVSNNQLDCSLTSYFNDLKSEKNTLYNELNELIHNNCWINHFLNQKNNNVLKNKQNWIDFESEISKVIQTLDVAKHKFKSDSYIESNQVILQEYEYEVLQYVIESCEETAALQVYLDFDSMETLIKKLLLDLNRLIRCLEIYLADYIQSEIYNIKDSINFINELKIRRVLTFNYTKTYEHVYANPDIKIDYIHGEAKLENDLDTCNLVLGIDEYLSDEEKNNNVEFIQFKKFFQRIYKRTGCLYKDWIKEHKERKLANSVGTRNVNLYFIGHSLDVTDKDILRELILYDYANTTIYYHNQESLGRMISNLVKVIGEDELIRRTGGSIATIKFVQQPN